MTTATYLAGHAELARYLGMPWIADAGELAVLGAAMIGALLGFLWFNCHPAQVFMGDTGALPLGALLGLLAVTSRQELLLFIVGGVFVVEALSVILQVAWYRRFRRRIFLCAPLHHHFQFKGWPESRIVVRFWIAAALCALVGLAGLKLRVYETAVPTTHDVAAAGCGASSHEPFGAKPSVPARRCGRLRCCSRPFSGRLSLGKTRGQSAAGVASCCVRRRRNGRPSDAGPGRGASDIHAHRQAAGKAIARP